MTIDFIDFIDSIGYYNEFDESCQEEKRTRILLRISRLCDIK